MSITDRNSLANLVMLCPNCHDEVDNHPDRFTIEHLRLIKLRHEAWASSLRQMGQLWSARFQAIDFINLPRILALPGGEAIWDAAKDIEIDDSKPLRMNDVRSGIFVGRIRPIFEGLRARATALNSDTIGSVNVGSLVSFESAVRSRDVVRPYKLRADPGQHPTARLEFKLDQRQVTFRFDPRWITTQTALNDLIDASSSPALYVGIGMVIETTEKLLRASALVLGRPMSAEVAAFNYVNEAFRRGVNIREVNVDDFIFRPPTD